MDSTGLKQKLETITCHIHGDAAHITIVENNMVEIETCCLLFRHQLLLMAGKDRQSIKAPTEA
jgi:hypothetical protein